MCTMRRLALVSILVCAAVTPARAQVTVSGDATVTPRPRQPPLICCPLLYQDLTPLRPNAVPASAGDVLDMRAGGQQASCPIGESGGDAEPDFTIR